MGGSDPGSARRELPPALHRTGPSEMDYLSLHDFRVAGLENHPRDFARPQRQRLACSRGVGPIGHQGYISRLVMWWLGFLFGNEELPRKCSG